MKKDKINTLKSFINVTKLFIEYKINTLKSFINAQKEREMDI